MSCYELDGFQANSTDNDEDNGGSSNSDENNTNSTDRREWEETEQAAVPYKPFEMRRTGEEGAAATGAGDHIDVALMVEWKPDAETLVIMSNGSIPAGSKIQVTLVKENFPLM